MTTQAKAALVKHIEGTVNFDEIMDDIIAGVAENLSPEDVFSDEQLQNWAENNGYVVKE